ncbi:hypothetical protein PHYBLDRAFT_166788 [Phycomyces blakesleeanus NRRL 1555(-)]|uniref:OTU domain-containing protein n=1 Tax=Phycomyces blakesleeanus (strain ATCC 8743b / DSM 1359 / FGSC 10004 / NBRC 33097 / NRRL 1555) TaxID=763407 RepID=A0A162UDZ9_PHYB8|nr:hypothetical protein PHYBLDRAFT_166788 [Phycomyces blakesleeanus NRRL 1555(-)]OAD75552.1 hypothetical protein PHYBLDRAFT_166788 [Phycomyces blakesleeanus NRRL 1555(-)]|eukprot:XP_018293592.1 hypothetical protein PHYBLDRAFT_166788 [Phycomyces blakesleeanus NRRL 1555(-)]
MKDKENWVNMYVYKHAHFGNRMSNRVESAHASLKHSFGTSPGKLKTVTLKVADRKHRLMVESLGEETKIVFDKVNATRLNDVRLKVCRFAMDQIKLELSKSIIPKKLAKECKCLIQYNYLLPCYHTLAKFDTIPISCIPRRWRKNYLEEEKKEQKKQKISSAKEQKAIKNIINLGSPCDPTLLTNLTIAPKHISTIFSPEADRNCGYRAIAMEVYQDQEEWSKVKDKMLETFLKHQNNYYHGRMEHGNMPASNNPLIHSLQDKCSPLPQQHWFGTIDHPQLVANIFSRAVAVYWNTPIETGYCLFVSFATLPEKVEPIIIILDINHFLLAKHKNTRNFCWPKINPFHKRIIQKHGLEDYSLMY